MSRHQPQRSGFTVIEMLVVIGIIVLLVGLVVPALSGVQRRSRKTEELSNLRQVSFAWLSYANSNNGNTLPGYLDEAVQDAWNLHPEFPDHSDIPPAVAAPWTWRLMPFLNDNHEILHGYLDEDDVSTSSMIAEADFFSRTPAYGYNAYYIGGWWEMVQITDPDTGETFERPMHRFHSATVEGRPVPMVARAISQIRHSDFVVTFCSSTHRAPGVYKRTLADEPGSYLVVPSVLANERQWRIAMGGGGPALDESSFTVGGGDTLTLEALIETDIPAGRYTGAAAVLYADGHCDSQTPGALIDQRRWIDAAAKRNFTHQP